jgi:ATP-binding cassette subfamily F protein 3
LDDYSAWVAEQRTKDKKQADKTQAENEVAPTDKKNSYAQNKVDRQARLAVLRPLIKESEKLERDIAAWQLEKTACDKRLNAPTLYENSDKTELQALLKLQSELTLNIEQAEERWFEVHEKLEAIPEINA